MAGAYVSADFNIKGTPKTAQVSLKGSTNTSAFVDNVVSMMDPKNVLGVSGFYMSNNDSLALMDDPTIARSLSHKVINFRGFEGSPAKGKRIFSAAEIPAAVKLLKTFLPKVIYLKGNYAQREKLYARIYEAINNNIKVVVAGFGIDNRDLRLGALENAEPRMIAKKAVIFYLVNPFLRGKTPVDFKINPLKKEEDAKLTQRTLGGELFDILDAHTSLKIGGVRRDYYIRFTGVTCNNSVVINTAALIANAEAAATLYNQVPHGYVLKPKNDLALEMAKTRYFLRKPDRKTYGTVNVDIKAMAPVALKLIRSILPHGIDSDNRVIQKAVGNGLTEHFNRLIGKNNIGQELDLDAHYSYDREGGYDDIQFTRVVQTLYYFLAMRYFDKKVGIDYVEVHDRKQQSVKPVSKKGHAGDNKKK